MTPAFSVIVFTTLSGAGYGLLALLSVCAATGLIPRQFDLGVGGLGLALALIVIGLLSSLAHLGHPRRVWRALRQWRSSWLSREGLCAVATFAPAALLWLAWLTIWPIDGFFPLVGFACATMAILTVFCTGMIYASLTTIDTWNRRLVMPLYILFALASGAVLFNAVLLVFKVWHPWAAGLSLGTAATALLVKTVYWRSIDGCSRRWTMGTATGLDRFGQVTVLDPPHTQPNFVMREMGYKLADRRVALLRRLVMALAFIGPLLCLLAILSADGPQTALAAVAALSITVGLILERWLFFAEARHVALQYYGSS